MKLIEIIKKMFWNRDVHELENNKQETTTQEVEANTNAATTTTTTTTKKHSYGREYYRGLVLHFCTKFGGAIIYVGKNDPAIVFENFSDMIEDDIVKESLKICVDRFNRMSDDGDPEDFEKGKRLAFYIDPSLHTPEQQALYLLGIYDGMDIESLTPEEAFECSLICNHAEKFELCMALLDYAAINGDCSAMYQKGFMASEEGDYQEAMKWYQKCAQKGMSFAQFALGNYYYYGKGTAVDYSMAVEWYTMAAEQGLPQAQCNLGACYYYGQGVEVDYVKAAYWYKMSADQGEPNAIYNLGTCYLEGQGTEVDLLKAAECFSKAAELGHPHAAGKAAVVKAMIDRQS